MKPKVIVYNKIPQEVKSYIEEECDVTYFENVEPQSLSKDPIFLQKLKKAEGILGSELIFDRKILDQAPLLKIVCNSSVGYNNLDIPELTERNIIATNTPDVLTDTTADTIFGLLVATARRITELDRFVKNKQWNRKIDESHFGVDVHHKVLGIIGMGRIGCAIAKRARLGFDMDILYHNRKRNEEAELKYEAKYCGLDELLKMADYVCVMVPLNSETENSIGEREFNLMKKSAVLIVGSRGRIVNEGALFSVLKDRKIFGAGLDVFEKEPIDENNPLLTLKNVVTLPHIGSATIETRLKMAKLAADNLLKGLKGKRPQSILNIDVLKNLNIK